MKYKKTNHWTDKNNQLGLLFFAHILDESLFDYTLESFKPQALNPRLLCIELLQTIDNIKSGVLKNPNIKPILEELYFTFAKDPAIKEILGYKYERIIERIKSAENNLTDLKNTILHIYHHLDRKKYLEKIRLMLIYLIPTNQEKEHIYYLTKSYLTELINYGYNPGHIYYKANMYFFNRNNPVNVNTPEEFFNIFDFKKKSFSVIYRVKSIFKEFESISQQGKFSIKDEVQIESLSGREKGFIDEKSDDEVFIVFENLETYDEITARFISEIRLGRITNLFSFYHHKEKPKINDKALVINNLDNTFTLNEKPIKSIIKKEDIKPKDAALKVKGLYESLELPQKSLTVLLKAIDIHSIALETDETENKLLNLWTAVETLIPKEPESGIDRIVQIMKGLVPFQSVNYIKNIIEQASTDLFYFNKRLASETLASVITDGQEERWYRICALIATSENEPNRLNLYSNLEDFPLLRWRIFWINKQLASAKKTQRFLNNHIQKVEWQIQRIYRVRNLIVHSGTTPTYTNVLVENLHNYFDNMVSYIIDNTISKETIRSIKEGIICCDIEMKEIHHKLTQLDNNDISLENYKQILGLEN